MFPKAIFRTPALIAAAVLGACGGTSYNQGDDLYTYDTAEGDGGADDGGTDDTGDGGTDDGGAGDGGADDTGTPVAACTHAWHPIHETGWTKTFEATFNGTSGTATEQGLGPAGDEEGVYLYRDAIDAGSNAYDVTITVGCDTDGEGLFVLSWEGDYSYSLMGIPLPGSVVATLDPYRRYLPPEYAVGSFGSWDYDYELTMLMSDAEGGKPETTVFRNTGTFDEYGFETITLADGTEVEAYKLVNTYSMAESSGMFALEGVIEQWWVEGLGLVREINTNTDDGSEIVTRELTAWEGLEIAE